MSLKHNTAVLGAAAIVGAFGIGGVMTANADPNEPGHQDAGDN